VIQHSRLLTNRRLNELDFTHLSLALSDDSDVRRFDVPRAGIRAAEGTLVGADDVEETIFVSTARADQLIDDEVVPVPTAVKIDVEGATPAVLRGFGDYLGEISLAYIETHGDKQRTEDLLREYGLEPSDSTSKGTMYVAE
jgi:FkbM family methyltransferase